MTVLVTGGAGYIGSHTVVELLSAGHETIIVDDLSNAKGDVIDRIETITGKRPEFYQFNAADKERLRDVFASYKPEHLQKVVIDEFFLIRSASIYKMAGHKTIDFGIVKRCLLAAAGIVT